MTTEEGKNLEPSRVLAGSQSTQPAAQWKTTVIGVGGAWSWEIYY